MIQKVRISNFFSVREDVEISFEASKERQGEGDWVFEIGGIRLLKALLLYGANGSGKTNILWALDFLRNVAFKIPRDLDGEFHYKQFAFDPLYKDKETSFDLYFFVGSTRYYYQLCITPKYIRREELRQFQNRKQSRRVFLREYEVESGTSAVKFGTWLGLSAKDKQAISEATTRIVSVLAAFTMRNIGCDLLAEIRDYFKYRFFRVYSLENADEEVARALGHDSHLRTLVVKMLGSFKSNIVDIQVEDISRPMPEEARRFLMQLNNEELDKEEIANFQTIHAYKAHYIHQTPGGRFKLEDGLQSEGTRAFIRCLTLFYKAIKGDWLLALDEYGAGMQAKIQNLLLDFFLKFSNGAQLIIATQSLGLLDNANMRRDAIGIVSKDEYGQTRVNQDIVRKIHKNTKLRQAYLSGKFTSIDPDDPDMDLDSLKDEIHTVLWSNEEKGGVI